MSNSLQPREPQHARLPCPSTTPRVCLNSMSIESVMPSNHLILCRPLLFLPSILPSIRVFSNDSALCMSWPKYWSFSFSPSNEFSELISFRIDWFDLLAVQGTLQSLLQHHSSKASILWHSAFFMVQLSHLYMTTGKTIALTIRSALILTVVVQLLSCVLLLVIPMDCTPHQTPLSMRRRQEYWSRLPSPSPGDLHDPGIKHASPVLAGMFVTTEPPDINYQNFFCNNRLGNNT